MSFFEPLVGFEPTTPRLQITCSGQLSQRGGWGSLPYRAATTNYLCCDQALEDSKGAGRMGLTHVMSASEIHHRCFSIAGAKVGIFFEYAIPS